jgi:hypothetical protein
VKVLSPDLRFDRFLFAGQLCDPRGVCANADIVVVSDTDQCRRGSRLSVFRRSDNALVARTTVARHEGGGYLHELCFMSGDRHVAASDHRHNCVCIFSVDGAFVRHIKSPVFGVWWPGGIACSAFDELVVADRCLRRIYILGPDDTLLTSLTEGGRESRFSAMTMNGSSVIAADGAYLTHKQVIMWS